MELKRKHKSVKKSNQNQTIDYTTPENNIIVLNIDSQEKDVPFIILGNSNFNQNYIHIREVHKNNTLYEGRYGYFSKIIDVLHDDIYTLTLFSNKRDLVFTSDYGISLRGEMPTFNGIIVIDDEVNDGDRSFIASATKDCTIIIR